MPRATKTRSARPGWSVTFSHPVRRDTRGNTGLKIRRGLGTRDDSEADRLVEQLNQILAEKYWWTFDRRLEAEKVYDPVVVAVFFDGMDFTKVKSKDQREGIIPLPKPDDGYARVMLVGSTGAGKTTLLRQIIGSDHKTDRFPSTSTAKTTTCDIEIVTGPAPFRAVITFMTESQVRGAVEECLEEACINAIRSDADAEIAASLLEHREQRFRLSYILGSWPLEISQSETYTSDDLDDEDEDEAPVLFDDEIVVDTEHTENTKRLLGYVERIKHSATEGHNNLVPSKGRYEDMENANQRQDWLEDFTNKLYESGDFSTLSLDIMEAIQERFDLIDGGTFQKSPTGWPIFWHFDEKNRDVFLKQVRWFSGNHDKQFGRLLTPLVDGIRVSGPFEPAAIELRDETRKFVLMDGEGLGHSAKEATSVSTRVTERFPEADMILLVDNAQSPLQAASLELLRSVGSSGHGHKMAVAFTHFDQVKGDNLGKYPQKRDHVHKSVGNAMSSLRDALGAPVTEILERQLYRNDFYLSNLDRTTDKIPRRCIKELEKLLEQMQASAEMPVQPDLAPIYSSDRLELILRDAADGFKNPWRGRLGLSYYPGEEKQHWARVKALCRRIAGLWDNNEYNGLRPVADFVSKLQSGISLWLDNPATWTREPKNKDEGQEAINVIRKNVYEKMHGSWRFTQLARLLQPSGGYSSLTKSITITSAPLC